MNTKKKGLKRSLTEERIANHKLALFIASAISFAINLMLIILLAIDGISFLYIMFPMLLCILSVGFIVLSAYTNFRFSYSLWYTVIYSFLFAVTAVMFGLVLMGFGKESAMTYFAIGLWALVNLLNLITIISGSVRAGSFKGGMRATIAILLLVASIGGYIYYVTQWGFFGQGAETSDRPVTFVYDEEEKYYVATGTLNGKGKIVTVPEKFNGIKVGAIDCSIFSLENVHTVELCCAADVEFRNTEKLLDIPENLTVKASKDTINGITSTVYAMAASDSGKADAILEFAKDFAPSDLAADEIYITFTYTADSVKAAEGTYMPMWIGKTGDKFSFENITGIDYVTYSDISDESILAKLYEEDAAGGGYILSDIKDAKGNSLLGASVSSSMDNVCLNFEKIYRVEVKADNDGSYELEDDFRFESDSFAYRYVTKTTASALIAEADLRDGFDLSWTYALGESNEQTALTDLLAVVTDQAEENISIYPSWTLKTPTINTCTTNGTANTFTYGDAVTFTATATAPTTGIDLRYEWFKGGMSIATTDSFDINTVNKVKMTDAGNYTVKVTAYSEGGAVTTLSSVSEQTLTLTVNKKALPITWNGISTEGAPFERVYEATDFAITVDFDTAAEVYEEDIEGAFSNYYTLSEPTIRTAGIHNVRITLNDELAAKYQISSADEAKSYTVHQKEVNIQWTVGAYTYSSQAQSPTVNIISGVFPADESDVSIVPTTFVPAGTHESVASLTGAQSANYKIYDNTSADFSSVRQSFTINKFQLTFDWNEYEQGVANTTKTYTSTALHPIATPREIPVNDNLASLALTYTDATIVGTHAISVSTGNPNYEITDANKTFSNFVITPAPITLSFDKTTLVYSGAEQMPTVKNSTLLGNDTREGLGLTVTGKVNAGQYKDSTSGMIEITLETLNAKGLTNYVIVADPNNSSYYMDGDKAYFTGFVIEPKVLTVNWSYTGTTYTGSLQKPTPSLVNSEICSRNSIPDTVLVSATVVGGDATALDVGGYDATAALSGDHMANYVIKEGNESCHFVINQAPIVINWSFNSTVYNGTAQMPIPSIASGVCSRNGIKDTVTVDAAVTGGDAVNVAEYIAVATLGGEHQSNYYITTTVKSQKFNIIKRSIDVTWNGAVGFNYTYNAEMQNPIPVTADTVFNSDVAKGYVALTTTGKTNCGQHTATASIDNKTAFDNYQISTGSTQIYNIVQRTINVTWDTSDISFTYAKESFSPYAQITDPAFVIDFNRGAIVMNVAGNTDAGQNLTAIASLAHGTSADATANYVLANATSHPYTIEPAVLDLNWAHDYNSTYTGTAKKPTPAITKGLKDGDNVSINVSVTGGSAVNVGSYNATATVDGLSKGNYVINTLHQTYTFPITARSVEVTWDKLSLPYDGTFRKPTVTIYDSVFQTDMHNNRVAVVIDNEDGYLDSNTYNVTAVLSGDATTVENYTLTHATDKFTITKVSISFVWGNATFTYDGDSHIPVASVTNTVFNNDLANERIKIVTTGAQTNADTYSSAAYATIEGDATVNYVINGNSQYKTFTIKPMEIDVTWGADRTFVYNGTVQTPSADAFGLDNIVVELTIKGKSGASTSNIATAESNNPNYVIKNGTKTITYTITPAPITVTWFNTSLTYNGQANRKPTATLADGRIGNETINLNVTVDREAKNVGTYTATVTSLNANYYVPDNTTEFTISPTIISALQFGDAVAYNGGKQNPKVTGATGLKGSDTLAGLNLTFSNQQTNVDDTGVTITIGNSNYVFSDDTGTTPTKNFYSNSTYIKAKDVTVIWTPPSSFVYSGQAKAYTATADGAVITLTYYLNGSSISAAINVGTYTVRATTTDKNYNLTDVERSFSITPATANITWDTSGIINGGSYKYYTYNGNTQGPVVSGVAGFSVNDVVVTYQRWNGSTWETMSSKPMERGSYRAVVSKASTASADNFVLGSNTTYEFRIQ